MGKWVKLEVGGCWSSKERCTGPDKLDSSGKSGCLVIPGCARSEEQETQAATHSDTQHHHHSPFTTTMIDSTTQKNTKILKSASGK